MNEVADLQDAPRSVEGMRAGWMQCFVEDIAAKGKSALATGPFGSAIGAKHFVNYGVPVIRGGNLSTETGVRIVDDGFVFLDKEKASEFGRSTVRAGDLIFTCWGTINQVGLIDDRAKYSQYVISNKQMKLTVDPEMASPLFLYYLFSGPEKQQEILTNAIGAAVPGFNLGQLRRMELCLPSKQEQIEVAAVLASLDDKIDLLHRQNKTLEAMAGTLFRQWFVELVEDDWIEYAVGDFAEHLKIPVSMAKNPEEEFLHYSLPAFDDGMRPVVEAGSQILSNKFKVEPWVMLVSKLNPRVPRIWPVGELAPEAQAICSTEFQVLRPTSAALFGYLYCLLGSSEAKDALAMAASGTSGSHQRVRPEDILNIKTRLPSNALAEQFSELIQPSIVKLLANINQIRSLEKLRDTLLPKLMSGEVRVHAQAAA